MDGTRMKLTKEQLASKAWSNVVVNITGESKSGKTHLAIRSEGPRYVAYLDRNTSLPFQILKANEEGFEWDEVNEEIEEILPVPYESLTVDGAEQRVKLVESLALLAILRAKTLASEGRHGGIFIVDGALLLKGYIEKWKLGDSATLGYRAKRGERGVSPLQYAESNAYFNDFVSRFAGQNIDLVLTWEGRRIWEEYYDDTGAKQRRATNRFRSTGPESMSYAINAEVQTMAVTEPVVVANKITDQLTVKHRVLIGYNAFNSNLRGRVVKVDSFIELKELFLDGVDDSRFVAPVPSVVETD
jgi:hypothetical protein